MQKRGFWQILITSLIVVYAAGFIGYLFTSSKVNSLWFQSIRPSITPPNYYFPIIWSVLYLMIALSLALAWFNTTKKEQKSMIGWAFGINLVLNALWSILFFGMTDPTLAFIDIIAIWLTIIWMILVTYNINKPSSYLLIPYFLWVSFAAALNYLAMAQ